MSSPVPEKLGLTAPPPATTTTPHYLKPSENITEELLRSTDSESEKRHSSSDDEAPAEAAAAPPPPADLEDDIQRTQSGSIYSIYTRGEKWMLTFICAWAGFHSPLPANIYLPAIPQMAIDFDKSIAKMNLTVTTYLVFQGCAPMFWGPLSDRFGRRPAFLGCMTVLIASCIGLAFCPTDAFWFLLLLRCMQSAGSASTIALGAGVIGDISIPEERGGFFGVFNVGPMIAPAFAPTIGGALSQTLGWRSTFWFLVISASVCFLLILLFYPETSRNLAGNGSFKMLPIYRAFFPIIGRGRIGVTDLSLYKQTKPYVNPFTIFLYPDVCLMLSFTSIIYATWYTITATISSSFKEIYDLSPIELGLWYIPLGCGMIIGAAITGKIQDWEYKRVKAAVPADQPFPKEYARLRSMPIYIVFFSITIISWGFSLQYKAPKGILGFLAFIIGYGMVAVLNSTSTLLIDLFQNRSSAATACTNFVRCCTAAIFVAVIDQMTSSKLQFQYSYLLLGCLCLCTSPLIWTSIKVAPKWRIARDRRMGLL